MLLLGILWIVTTDAKVSFGHDVASAPVVTLFITIAVGA